MKINISIFETQCGTELGELCDPTYTYACQEDKNFANANANDNASSFKQLTIDDVHPELKNDFINKLNRYLNDNYWRWQPEDYQFVLDRIRLKTIKNSGLYSVGAIMGLFANMPIEIVCHTNKFINKADANMVALTCTQVQKNAMDFAEAKSIFCKR